MSRFINLTSTIINTARISQILIKPNQYQINLITNKFEGSMYFVNSSMEEITVCKKENPQDYKSVSDWIYNCSKENTKDYIKYF
jgi:hypothetical protein